MEQFWQLVHMHLTWVWLLDATPTRRRALARRIAALAYGWGYPY